MIFPPPPPLRGGRKGGGGGERSTNWRSPSRKPAWGRYANLKSAKNGPGTGREGGKKTIIGRRGEGEKKKVFSVALGPRFFFGKKKVCLFSGSLPVGLGGLHSIDLAGLVGGGGKEKRIWATSSLGGVGSTDFAWLSQLIDSWPAGKKGG